MDRSRLDEVAALDAPATNVAAAGDNPLRVGVIGTDPRGFGARAHIPGIQQSASLTLEAVCSAHDETARAAAERHGVKKWYSDVDELVADDEIDIVTVAVRPRMHLPLVRTALSGGKAVYCEWPLGADTREAEEMADLARSNGVPSAVGLQGRFSPSIQRMREMVSDGVIGRPLAFQASMLQAPFQVFSDKAWLAERSEASGALFVATAHLTDAIQYVLGPLGSVTAATATLVPMDTYADTGEEFRWNTHDTVMYLARLASGALGTVNVSNVTKPGDGFRFTVSGEDGQLAARSPVYMQFSPITVQLLKGEGADPVEVIEPDPIVEGEPGANVGRALEAFGDSIESASEFSPDFDDAVRLHRLIDEIDDSGRRFA